MVLFNIIKHFKCFAGNLAYLISNYLDKQLQTNNFLFLKSNYTFTGGM